MHLVHERTQDQTNFRDMDSFGGPRVVSIPDLIMPLKLYHRKMSKSGAVRAIKPRAMICTPGIEISCINALAIAQACCNHYTYILRMLLDQATTLGASVIFWHFRCRNNFVKVNGRRL